MTTSEQTADPSARTIRYGDHPDQHVVVRTPPIDPRWTAVLIHGGYWRSKYTLDLMDPLADALTASGIATWNVEYRRPDEHGWDAMTADVAAALTLVESSVPIVVLGHSAGGQLALRVCADMPAESRPALAVSLAGVIDLEKAQARDLGDGAVTNALGHAWSSESADDVASSPRHRLPLRIPQIIACGFADNPHLLAMSHDYAPAAAEAGDSVTEINSPGDHFAIIDPTAPLWANVLNGIERALGG